MKKRSPQELSAAGEGSTKRAGCRGSVGSCSRPGHEGKMWTSHAHGERWDRLEGKEHLQKAETEATVAGQRAARREAEKLPLNEKPSGF